METGYIANLPSGSIDPEINYQETAKLIEYVPRREATAATYSDLGFKCGLEIHQQLLTKSKLFCRCPAGIYQEPDDYDAEVVRHMRPTLSEMGEYDGTALMEKRTRKNIFYRIKNRTACTYEVDDTPPFKIDREALGIAIEIALLLKTSVVGELHITRKQYLDGSIPTGFQRTAIVGIEGEIPISTKRIRIIQLSIEEDSCREVSDIGHDRVYMTDRLGMPLIETVTYPDMLTPEESAEAAQYLRFLVRSTGHVRTGIGAARQDVNVSIIGGTRVEIKGVSHIRWIPDLTHNEMFRQRALLEIKKILAERIPEPETWRPSWVDLSFDDMKSDYDGWRDIRETGGRLTAMNLPEFKGLLSFFTQPGHVFADELAGRLKVIACLERPNLVHSEQVGAPVGDTDWALIRDKLQPGDRDAQVLVWGPDRDVTTALETIEERCRMAFEGVPNETRKSLSDGTTIFERVLPGPDRMYPDTDSAPIAIPDEDIEKARTQLPAHVSVRMQQLREWKIPTDTFAFLLGRNLVPVMERIVNELGYAPGVVGKRLGQQLKSLEGTVTVKTPVTDEALFGLFEFVKGQKLDQEIIAELLPVIAIKPGIDPAEALRMLGFRRVERDAILKEAIAKRGEFTPLRRSRHPNALVHWLMGELRPIAVGNMSLTDLLSTLESEVQHG